MELLVFLYWFFKFGVRFFVNYKYRVERIPGPVSDKWVIEIIAGHEISVQIRVESIPFYVVELSGHCGSEMVHQILIRFY